MGISDESRIVSEILCGDAEAYAILVKRYQKPIYNLMIRMTSSQEDAFDLTQETFLRAYERLEKYNPSSRFFPWLYTLGLNLARDFLRKGKRENAKSLESELAQRNFSNPSEQEEVLLERLDAGRLKNVLEKLSLDYREAIILRFHEGMSMKDIALALGISVSGAKMRVHRGLLMLRHLLSVENVDAV